MSTDIKDKTAPAFLPIPALHPDWIDPRVDLVGVDVNAFSVMGFLRHALVRAGNSEEVVSEYLEQAKASDYDHLIGVSILYAGTAPYDLHAYLDDCGFESAECENCGKECSREELSEDWICSDCEFLAEGN